MTLGAGESFAGYTIVKQLGSGGMGEVYLAEHPRLPRRDALKVMRSEISADITFRARFIREAESIAALQHPHIVTVYDRGEEDGQVWIATQYIDGFDASELLLRHRYPNGIPVDEALDIATAIADALDHAHGHGLIHRDVKPANILLARPDRDGIRRTYLADFGIARPLEETAGLTSTNFVLGTFAYAAPEQLMGSALDGRADQYALAAAVYHLLTGTTVFPDSNQVAVISRKLTRPAPAPSAIRPELAPLDRAFARALAKNPEHRFQRCRDFAAAIASDAARGSIGYPSTAATQHAAALNPKRTNNFGMTAHDHPEYPSRLARTSHSQIEDSTRLVDTYAVGRNLTAARARLEKAAKDGDIGAMNSLGVLLDSSLDPPDLPAARFWYEKAASAGHTPAMFNLGVLLLFKWDPLDLDGACTWWERAAKNGHADAMNYLGEMAHASNDLTAARSWWEKAAEIGQLDAMNALGVLLECEWDPPDPAAAQAWYEKAAAAGHLEAMNNLGLLLESLDVDAAIMWWERAAHGGHLGAVANLARLHFFLQDLPQSRFWGERAADAGHLDSMMTLGILLESYWDPPDLDAASAWYEKAAQSVRNKWSEVREAVRRQSRVVDVMLADARVRRVEDSNLILIHRAAPVAKRLNASESKEVIRAALKEVLEVDWRVRCEAGDLQEKQSAALLTPGQ